MPKGSLEISAYCQPVLVSMAVEELEARPGTTPERAHGRLTAGLRDLLSSRRMLVAITVIGLHFFLGSIFAINTATTARSSATASYPLEVTFLSAGTSRAVASPFNPAPLLKNSFHIPEFPAILIEEEIPIPSSSMAITIPAPNERRDRAQPPPALNAADFNSSTLRGPCAARRLSGATNGCTTRGLPSHP